MVADICFKLAGNDIGLITVACILLLIWDAAIKAYRYRGNLALYRVVYSEGIIYYFYLFGFSVVNIALLRLGAVDTSYSFMLTSMSRVFHSRLTSRILLHICKAGLDRDADEVEHISVEHPGYRPPAQIAVTTTTKTWV
ncbi:hypothetical protein NLJ89_g9784 [Agrocybe chaxingu]|uniref:Uncharacterized protein n=1 Tax=Agrocybe chaxingu TaxID=84603 RepID=A0A9W8JQ44_9AGAR|nr:hypothetical protein NLJ89_g9784 [Agrocybe chaxingu]